MSVSTKRLYEIILKPIVSEKSVALNGRRQYAFKVLPDAKKPEIAEAIRFLFKVDVVEVRTLNVKGKKKVFKQRRGVRSSWKKAYVTLPEGQTLKTGPEAA